MILRLAAFVLPVTCLPASPVNDSFAFRIALGSANSVSATGNNTGATLQTDENNLDSLGGSSIWWKWTAPADGWVNMDTIGSAIDTVLAVLADGPALDDTYVVGFNDESGDPAAPFGTSRVIFQATAGREYHVAVHGFLGVQGDITVNVHAGITPPLRVTSLTLTPGSVNVTTASQTVTADIGIASDAAFAEGELALHRANFTGVTEIPVLAENRISGAPNDGVYRLTVNVPRYSSPGTWLVEVAASDIAGREVVFGRGVSAAFEYDQILPDGTTGLLPVTNTGVADELAPALAGFLISPGTANVAVNPANVTFTFRVTDSLSGFGSATLTLFTPFGEVLTVLPVTASHRTAGTALDGTCRVPFTLPARMPGGTWQTSLLIRDAAGNPALYDGAINGAPFPIGSTGSFAVTGAANSYRAWLYPRTDSISGTLPNDDFDADGISNLLEYALGLDIDRYNGTGTEILAGLPEFTLSAGALTLTYPRRNVPGLNYAAQFSNDLTTWTSASGGIITPGDELFEQVTVTDPQPGGVRRMGRLRVTLSE